MKQFFDYDSLVCSLVAVRIKETFCFFLLLKKTIESNDLLKRACLILEVRNSFLRT